MRGRSKGNSPQTPTISRQNVLALFITITFGLVRFLAAQPGSLDPSFNPDLRANNLIYGAAPLPDGGLMIVGAFTSVDGAIRSHAARLTANGNVDLSFNAGTGVSSGSISAVAVDGSERVLIGGRFASVNGMTHSNLARLNPDGSLDTSFSTHIAYANGGQIEAIVVQPDGKILIAGNFTSANLVPPSRLARLNDDATSVARSGLPWSSATCSRRMPALTPLS